jgi:hypothetical protein
MRSYPTIPRAWWPKIATEDAAGMSDPKPAKDYGGGYGASYTHNINPTLNGVPGRPPMFIFTGGSGKSAALVHC